VIVVMALALVGASTSAASVRVTWSGPRPIAPSSGASAVPIACPSIRQCTVLDGRRELTFDPFSAASTSQSLPAAPLALACPLATLCTAVTASARELTFDPVLPGVLRSRSLGRLYVPSDVACPSSKECVTIGGPPAGLVEVAYDPGTGRRIGAPLPADTFTFTGGLACPTRTECVALDDLNEAAITFQPLTGRALDWVPVRVARYAAPVVLGLACPGRRVCVAVNSGGEESAFDPRSRHGGHFTRIDRPGALLDVACASERACVAIDNRGRVLSGTPGHSGWQTTQLSDSALAGITCPSATECVALDTRGDTYLGRESTIAASRVAASPEAATPPVRECE
jgi:hypothetical protein